MEASISTIEEEDSELMTELLQHYRMWKEDNERRMNRKNGWNDVTDAYYGKLPDDWPYTTRITDPRIRTTLIEKNSRLLNSKLRGTLVPREGGDTISAQVNNSVLDYQWDTAKEGGSMLTKMEISDLDARMYASKFALVLWKYELGDIVDKVQEVLFDGNEMTPLDIRDCGIDPVCSHIRDAKWFQYRSWVPLEDLENISDMGKSLKHIPKLKQRAADKIGNKMSSAGAYRTTEYVPRGKTLRSLEDRTGEDMAFPVVKIVTEYRRDRWITFAPDYKLILRDIDNPYDHKRIPIAQLRYYPIQDDPLGESEVESVLPLWKAIQATICGYMDEVILKMRPPLKIIENATRVETIQYGPEAQWLVDRQDAIEEMRSGGDSIAYFETTYQALVAAFNVAMGDLSQGVSNFGPFESGEKTATEIKATERQRNTRDQKNQNDLSEFIKDIMMMWQSNNQQFLFSEADKSHHLITIIGQEQFQTFKRAGFDEMEMDPEVMRMLGDIVSQNPDMSDAEIDVLYESALIPKSPVVLNPNEKDPEKMEFIPKMKVSKLGDSADLAVVPEDLEGTYSYIPDVKAMGLGASEELAQSMMMSLDLLSSNEVVLQSIAEDGYRPDFKRLTVSTLEGAGLKDADTYFKKINEQIQPQIQPIQATPGATGQMGGAPQTGELQGLRGLPQTGLGGGLQPQVAGPNLSI